MKLHECISQIKKLGVDRLALEASSHGLEQHRLDGGKVSLACFTNLSHDHIDFHKSIENYKKQKFRLFEILQDSGTAVINIDDVSRASRQTIATVLILSLLENHLMQIGELKIFLKQEIIKLSIICK